MTRRAPLLAVVLAFAACRPEPQPEPHRDVTPPIESPNAIPDGPVSGFVRGVPFSARDARYVVDRRLGYAHTDIKISEGRADAPCGVLEPKNASSIWLRLEGAAKIESQVLRIGADAGAWSVHYQIVDGTRWVGVSDASAVVSLQQPDSDGKLRGAIAVCFSDDAKSCVSGSFVAQSCPSSIDQPVRGAQPPETIPEKYRLILNDAASPAGGR